MNVSRELLQIAKEVLSDDLWFVRWGGLSSVKQKGYDPNMPSFHSPPARRGIYAFVWPYIEVFLLDLVQFHPDRMRWVKDEEGNKTQVTDWDAETGKTFPSTKDYGKENAEWFLAKNIRPKRFKYHGDIWCHLTDAPRPSILAEKGGWVLLSYEDYKKALYKELGRMEQSKKHGRGAYSKDHLEVFIEKV